MPTMKAVVVNAPMDFEYRDVERPRCPSGGLLLRVNACGLCGGDLRTLRHGHRKVTLPFVLGHEVCGTIVERGSEYRGDWKEGDVLTVGPLVFCGHCDFCREGRYELCENYRELAQAWPGGFAEYLAVPAEAIAFGTIERIPGGMDPAIAAIVEPLSSVIHAHEKADVSLGDSVAIIGAGPIGCAHCRLARLRGASTVILADVNESRLEMAEDFEPDHTVNASEADLVEEVRRLTNGKGADVVVTANSVPETQVQAVEMARKGGRILLFGGLPVDQACPGVNMNTVHYNALQLIGTTAFAPRHFRTSMNLLASGRFPGDLFVTHRFPLADFAKGIDMAFRGEVRKAVFLP